MNVVKPLDISKELEVISFNAIREDTSGTKIEKGKDVSKENVKSWMLEYQIHGDANEAKSQYLTFQRAMKVLLLVGQCIGLNPVQGILKKDITKVKFTWLSCKFAYSVTLAIAQGVVTGLCFYKLFHNYINVGALGYVTFYLTSCCTTILFLRIATKWPKLLKDITNSGLDKYTDDRVIGQCKIASFTLLAMSLLEHILALISRLAHVMDCPKEGSFYEQFVRVGFPWFFELDVPYNLPIAVILQYINVLSTINWNYSDMFIVCISLYLTSVFEQVNRKIQTAADKSYFSPSVWGSLREDYTRAARLVKLFDNVFSSVVMLSFASNLFFICLQLFNVLTNGIRNRRMVLKECINFPSGPFLGFEHPIYLTYSVLFLFGRFLAVSLVAARVHTAAQAPAAAIYAVPAIAYSKEVQRFLDQVHGDNVALSGMQFFFITRELILSVAGTIVTYELVLLQFSSDELNQA